jgi:hypothetical protein
VKSDLTSAYKGFVFLNFRCNLLVITDSKDLNTSNTFSYLKLLLINGAFMKYKISISVDEKTIVKIREGIRKGKFRNRSHAFEYALQMITGGMEK